MLRRSTKAQSLWTQIGCEKPSSMLERCVLSNVQPCYKTTYLKSLTKPLKYPAPTKRLQMGSAALYCDHYCTEKICSFLCMELRTSSRATPFVYELLGIFKKAKKKQAANLKNPPFCVTVLTW